MSDTPTSLSVTATVDAPVERVFMLLSDPDRHPDLDASGMIQGSDTHTAITELGDVFTMRMSNPTMGDYVIENHVVVYDEDVAIGWAPAGVDREPTGHTYVWTLEPDGDDRTVLTQTYDWSAVTDETILGYFPVVTREQLEGSMDLVAEALM